MPILGESLPNIFERFIYKHLPFLNKPVSLNCICSFWFMNRKKYEQNVLLCDDYLNEHYTYGEFCDEVKLFAGGLQKLGLKSGQVVAQFAENSARWMVIDQAIMLTKAINAVRGSNAPKSELKYIYNHSDSTALITDSLDVINNLKDTLIQNNAKFILYLGKEEIQDKENFCIPFYDFLSLKELSKKCRYWNQTFKENDPATICYSSGTTGNPKGILLSHGNLVSQVKAFHPALRMKQKMCALCTLPIWHMYERTCEYYIMSRGTTLCYTNVRNFKKDLIKYRPHYLITVPRIWEAIYEGILAQVKKEAWYKRLLFNFFILISSAYKKSKRIIKNSCIYNQKPTIGIRIIAWFKTYILMPVDKLANKLVYKKLRNAIGGRYAKGICGGGALAPYIEDFFEAIGILLFVGYGLTETSPVLSVRREEKNKIYSVGPPIQNTEFKIVDPKTFKDLKAGNCGLVLARGPQIMLGYYKDPEATAAVMRGEWFITGDLGWLTNDNSLVLTGRQKDTIVLSNGENIEPEALEQICLKLDIIKQIVINGQDRSALCALIVLNEDELQNYYNNNGLKGKPSTNSKDFKNSLLAMLNNKIKSRSNFRPYERISDFRFVKEPFDIENGLMTQTGKLKKNEISIKYKKLIEEMY